MAETWKPQEDDRELRELTEALYRFVRPVMPNTADTNDVIGDTWLAAGRLYEARGPLVAFLMVTAKRRVGDYWRRWAQRGGLWTASIEDPTKVHGALGAAENPERDLETQYGYDSISHAMAFVPADYREVLTLRLRGYSNKEVSEMLDLDYNTVRSRTARGKRHLQRLLGGPGDD